MACRRDSRLSLFWCSLEVFCVFPRRCSAVSFSVEDCMVEFVPSRLLYAPVGMVLSY